MLHRAIQGLGRHVVSRVLQVCPSRKCLPDTRTSRAFTTTRPLDIDAMCERLCSGDRAILSRAITLAESSKIEHREKATELLNKVLEREKNRDGSYTPIKDTFRIAISGPPGVGKSTFIEAFGEQLCDVGHRVAVLAIDPSSQRTGGSILGDKTRMTDLARDPRAYVRPTPAGTALGGVARHTSEAMLLCEAAGFDVVLIETVGVGQSETTVHSMTDLFLFLVNPSGGDELQGIKRGIMELADILVVHKADGHLLPAAQNTAAEYTRAIGLIRPRYKSWKPVVTLASSVNRGDGIKDLLQTVESFRTAIETSGDKERTRESQRVEWMWSEITAQLLQLLEKDKAVQEDLPALEAKVANNELAFGAAADTVLHNFLRR